MTDSEDTTALANALTWTGAVLGAVLARRLLTALWVQVTGEEPPENPASSGVTWGDALMWGAAGGLAAGLSRTIGKRLAAGAAAKMSGKAPREVV